MVWAVGLESTLTCLEDPTIVIESVGGHGAEQWGYHCLFTSYRPCAFMGSWRTARLGVVQGPAQAPPGLTGD